MTTVQSSRRPANNNEDQDQDEGGALFSLLDRPSPHNEAAEKSTLGGAILSKDAIGDIAKALEPLGAAAFYKPAHETIWLAITDLYAAGTDITPISLGHQLTVQGDLDRVGGHAYISHLVSSCPNGALAVHDAEIVLDRAKLRRLAQTGNHIAQMATTGAGEADEILDAAAAALGQVTQTADASTGYTLMDEVFQNAVDEAEAIERDGREQGIPTGFVDLDALTNGFLPGQMIVVAARPAMGKSTLAIDFVRAASIKHRLRSAVFSLEMSTPEIGMRILSAEARVGLHHLRSGTVTAEDWQRIARISDRVRSAPVAFSDSHVNTLTQIKAQCRRLKQNGGLDLVVIDYIQLLQTGGRRPESRQQEVSDISRNIKTMAKELQVPVIALSQLNRGPEQRTDKKPMVSDLRESGSIEQDADIVILLHREDAYDKETPRAGEADLIIAKHRNGPTATVTVAFQGHYSRFVDMQQT
ncbi:replicative DNA helicase [Streptomyces sp. NPDC006649]|uniref:replicative DNA helicase n=1 Tax=Streptomyces sp. NPDC006649 TaxID=3156896 RepID=UPI0033B14C59